MTRPGEAEPLRAESRAQVTYEPFRSTVVRANYEAGRFIASRPITVLPFNSIPDAWYQEGRQGFDWSYYDDPARNPAAVSQFGAVLEGLLQRPAGFGDSLLIVYSNPSAQKPGLG